MPDEHELGEAPTAITSVVQPTQSVSVPDPAWADQALPPPMEGTLPGDEPPRGTLPQRARAAWTRVVHEWKKLPSRTRVAAIAGGSLALGLVIGLGLGSAGRSAPSEDDELQQFAQRLSMPERDAVRRALSVSDPIAALMMLRAMGAKDHLAADPIGIALRGRLALVARDGLDALDQLEAALTAQPKLASEAWLPAAVVQTFMANKPGRTNALLGRLDKPKAAVAMKAACLDWQVRVRRGAADGLKTANDACPDPIGALVLDAFQADKCDSARAVLQKLVPLAPSDERIGGAIDALSRRPGIANCVADLIPRK